MKEQVDEVEIPGSEGYFGVLPGHTPMLASLAVGEMWYRKGRRRPSCRSRTASAEVLPDSVTILAQLAERAEDIDVARAEAERARRGADLAAAKDVDVRARADGAGEVARRLQVASRRVNPGGRGQVRPTG